MNFVWGLIVGILLSTVVCLLWISHSKKRANLECESSGANIDSYSPVSAIWPKKKASGLNNIDEVKKDENLQKIEEFIADKDRFTNDELQSMLGVSDTTTGRYLEELEHDGKIEQVGDGPDTYYIKK